MGSAGVGEDVGGGGADTGRGTLAKESVDDANVEQICSGCVGHEQICGSIRGIA
jgi:hypothetical protein